MGISMHCRCVVVRVRSFSRRFCDGIKMCEVRGLADLRSWGSDDGSVVWCSQWKEMLFHIWMAFDQR